MIRVAFGPASGPVVVEAETAALADGVRELFRPHLLEATASHLPEDDVHLRVLGDEGCYRLVEFGGEAGGSERTFDTLPDLMSAVEYGILGHMLRAVDGFTHLHAGGVVVGGHAIVAMGESGAGKSSLALAWSRSGLPLLGDDVVLLADDGAIHAFPRLVKVDRERLADHGLELDSTVAPDPDHPEAWVNVEEAGGWWEGGAPVGILARIRYDAGEQVRISQLDAVTGLRLLIESTLRGGTPPEESMDRYLAAMEGARIVEISFGSAMEAAEALTGLLENQASTHRKDP